MQLGPGTLLSRVIHNRTSQTLACRPLGMGFAKISSSRIGTGFMLTVSLSLPWPYTSDSNSNLGNPVAHHLQFALASGS